MARYLRHPLIYTWLFLVLATLLSTGLGAENALLPQQANLVTSLAILLIAIIKCRLVIRNYMEVRFAPRWLRWTCDAWLLLNLGMIAWAR